MRKGKIITALILATLLIATLACGADTKDVKNSEKIVSEVVVYRIKKDKIAAYPALAKKIHQELKTNFTGLISIKTQPSAVEPGVYLDVCLWESRKQALHAFKNFEKLPSAGKFIASFEGQPIYAGHFKTRGLLE